MGQQRKERARRPRLRFLLAPGAERRSIVGVSVRASRDLRAFRPGRGPQLGLGSLLEFDTGDRRWRGGRAGWLGCDGGRRWCVPGSVRRGIRLHGSRYPAGRYARMRTRHARERRHIRGARRFYRVRLFVDQRARTGDHAALIRSPRVRTATLDGCYSPIQPPNPHRAGPNGPSSIHNRRARGRRGRWR
jgi:hypothetical protein